MKRVTSRALPLALLLAGALVRALPAQGPPALGQGFDPQRTRPNTQAPDRFPTVLQADPPNLPALPGLGGVGGWGPAGGGLGRAALARNRGLPPPPPTTRDRPPTPQRAGAPGELPRGRGVPPPRRTAADLLLVWERAGEAWTLLDSALPA